MSIDWRDYRTILLDMDGTVLDAAKRFGIRGVVAVTRPDTRLPIRDAASHRGIPGLISLL